MKTLSIVLMGFLAGPLGLATASTYFVDSTHGDDAASGVSETAAWKTLERVNAHLFQPGDRLLFRAGSRFVGQFKPRGSGDLDQAEGRVRPIVVDRYGAGPDPRLDGEGRYVDTVLLQDVEFWELNRLEITNLGTNRAPWRTGVRLVAERPEPVRHLRLRHLFVHDVNGDLRKSHEGCGIFFEARGPSARFDGVLIEGCRLLRTDRNGICQRRSRGAARSTGVVIRGNLLEDIGGDAIKTWGSDGSLVAHNVVRGARTRCDDYAAGIWPWDCDDTVIQFNEVSGVRGIKDGQAFDSDYRCRRSVFQYNYSHDNDGGFFLVCSPGNSWNEDTVIRFNLSQRDGLNTARVFHFAGRPANTQVYHNTIHIGPDQDLPMIRCTDWDRGWATNTVFRNNLFLVEGRVRYEFGRSGGWIWENNVFCGRHENPPSDPRARFDCPPLIDPGSGRDGFTSLGGYRFRASAGDWRGVPIPDPGLHDLLGNALSAGHPLTVGAVLAQD